MTTLKRQQITEQYLNGLKTLATRGGKREGSGRPKGKPTKTLSYRVPEKLAARVDKKIREVIKKIVI